MSRWEQYEIWTFSAEHRQWAGSFAELEVAAAMARARKDRVLLIRAVYENQKRVKEETLMEIGLPRDHIVQDPTCATLGYGLEYSYSIYQRYHLNGLRGDADLAFPMSAGTTNAWGAREAYMGEDKHPEWGLRELRGPLWEVYTAICLCVAGMDLAMMFHPVAAQMFRELVNSFEKDLPSLVPQVSDWITMKV